MKTNRENIQVDFVGGKMLDFRSFKDRSFLRNIFQMPCICGFKNLGFLNIKDWTNMLDYIEEYRN